MKVTEADVVWTPAHVDAADAGSVRVERHLSNWRRTRGELWMPAATAWEIGRAPSRPKDPIAQLMTGGARTSGRQPR